MMILQAPMPTPQTTTVLPNPQFGDGETPSHTIDVKQSMNGTTYSYVKSNARSKLQYTLTLSRMKALELRAFIVAYYRAQIRLTNHLGEVWDVYFTVNPFEFNSKNKSSAPGGATIDITLEMEGVLVTPVTPPAC
jgi:hypothetical protein